MNQIVNAVKFSPVLFDVATVMIVLLVLAIVFYMLLYGPRSSVR